MDEAGDPGPRAGPAGAGHVGAEPTRAGHAVAGPAEGRTAAARRGLAKLITRAADRVSRLLGVSPADSRETISEAELRALVAANTVLRREERALIGDVLAAAQRQVREVMVPRTDVVFLDASVTLSRALRQVMGQMHSRYPVADGSSDEVVGYVQMRDLVAPPVTDRTMTVGQLASEIERLPSSKPLIAALAEMRREGRRMALVVDEYGGTAGIITLEDLVEGLVGELHPEQAPVPEPSAVDGRMNLASLTERTGLRLADGPYETVAGYLMAALGTIPAVGDEVRVDGWRITVVAMDGRRVATVRVAPPEPASVGPLAPDRSAVRQDSRVEPDTRRRAETIGGAAMDHDA